MNKGGALTPSDISALNRMCPPARDASLGTFLSLLGVVSQEIAVGGFTDGGGTSGYIDLTDKLPAGAIPLGWKFVGSGAFDGDTSATLQVGVSGDTDRFSADTAGSVFAKATIGSSAIAADACKGIAAQATARVTVTTGTDFGLCKTAGHGAGTLYLYYLNTAR